MEEILASIRRIIEDSDTVKKPSAFDRQAPSHFEGEEGDEPAFEPANSDVVSFLRPADLAERESADRDQAVAATPAQAGEPEVPEVQADPSPIAAGPEVFGETETFELPDDFAAEFEELQAALEQDAHARDDTAHEAPPPLEPIAEVGRAPILSENAGRQVAASFGELTDAFAASRRKSFDEMAEDMLRPMLQEWLDDNLPTLVERLVREEIERVARGGSR